MAQASFLTGEFRHALDDRGRIAIPARFRSRLGQGATLARWLDRCLGVFPSEEWSSLAEKIRGLPRTNPNAREFVRFMSGPAAQRIRLVDGGSMPTLIRLYEDPRVVKDYPRVFVANPLHRIAYRDHVKGYRYVGSLGYDVAFYDFTIEKK